MSEYRRWFVPGGTYFFTLVSFQRRRILTTDFARQCLRTAFHRVRRVRPFQVVAIVLMPNHLHTVWSLPAGDGDFSARWQKIKEYFTRAYIEGGGREPVRSESRKRQQERALWQRRFWEHACRDEDDVRECVDYIHWNPVKHRLVARVRDWKWSSFHRFVGLGEYEIDWGGANPCPGRDMPE